MSDLIKDPDSKTDNTPKIMSLKRGETAIDTLYVGLQNRTLAAPGETEPKGFVYTITKDQVQIFGAPFITLEVGKTYRFIIDTPGHPFYITDDVAGGGVMSKPMMSMIGAITIEPECTGDKGNVGIEKGILTWTPDSLHSQMTLYYQCNFHKYMGNRIYVNM